MKRATCGPTKEEESVLEMALGSLGPAMQEVLPGTALFRKANLDWFLSLARVLTLTV